jgi:hypothetical protein
VWQAFRFPLKTLLDGFSHWHRHGARLRRARILCQCADSLRLRRARGFEPRALGLYRRSLRSLQGLADGGFADDPGVVAHRALSIAQRPYRAAALASLVVVLGLALAGFLAVAAGSLVSVNLRARFLPVDLAAGRPWSASNGDGGRPSSGIGPSSDERFFFHTTSLARPWVEIDLGAEHLITGFRVVNRSDCCQERALPLNFEVWDGQKWQLIAQRHAWFSTWTADLEPVRARKVRLLHPGKNFLHLKRISVYGR